MADLIDDERRRGDTARPWYGDGLVLRDGEVVLRTPTYDDVPALVDAVRGSADHLRPWMPWASRSYDEADGALFLDLVVRGVERSFLILEDDGARLAGVCGLNRYDAGQRTANLGYWLRADATGRGLATRATRLVLAWGLGDCGLERIEIQADVDNVASQRVPARLGLTDEGVRQRALRVGDEQRDVRVFAAFRSDLARLSRSSERR